MNSGGAKGTVALGPVEVCSDSWCAMGELVNGDLSLPNDLPVMAEFEWFM